MLAKIGSENGKYVVDFKQMQRLALGSVFIFQGRFIGLDYYKGKDFMSRVVLLQREYRIIKNMILFHTIIKNIGLQALKNIMVF